MMTLEDVLKNVLNPGRLCIGKVSFDDCDKEGLEHQVVYDGDFDKMAYFSVRPFLNYEVFGIMAGDGTYGHSGVLYIDIHRPTDVKEEQA